MLPLDDRGVELFVLRRPGSESPQSRQRFPATIPHLERFKVPDIRNRSFEIIASVDTTDGTDGVLVASGSRPGGMVLYIQDGHLVFEYNFLGQPTTVRSTEPVPRGASELGVVYRKSAEHQGTATLVFDDGGERREVGSVDLETMPFRQALYGMDVGRDLGPTVSPDYAGPFAFEGRLDWVEFRLDDDRDDLQQAAAVEAENALVEQ